MIKWLDNTPIIYSSLRQNDGCNGRVCALQYESDYTYDHPSRYDFLSFSIIISVFLNSNLEMSATFSQV